MVRKFQGTNGELGELECLDSIFFHLVVLNTEVDHHTTNEDDVKSASVVRGFEHPDTVNGGEENNHDENIERLTHLLSSLPLDERRALSRVSVMREKVLRSRAKLTAAV